MAVIDGGTLDEAEMSAITRKRDVLRASTLGEKDFAEVLKDVQSACSKPFRVFVGQHTLKVKSKCMHIVLAQPRNWEARSFKVDRHHYF